MRGDVCIGLQGKAARGKIIRGREEEEGFAEVVWMIQSRCILSLSFDFSDYALAFGCCTIPT